MTKRYIVYKKPKLIMNPEINGDFWQATSWPMSKALAKQLKEQLEATKKYHVKIEPV